MSRLVPSAGLLVGVLLGAPPVAAVCQSYTDRAAWEAAVLAHAEGFDLVIEDFATDPGSPFAMEGADFRFLAGAPPAADLQAREGR